MGIHQQTEGLLQFTVFCGTRGPAFNGDIHIVITDGWRLGIQQKHPTRQRFQGSEADHRMGAVSDVLRQ